MSVFVLFGLHLLPASLGLRSEEGDTETQRGGDARGGDQNGPYRGNLSMRYISLT